MGTGSAKNYESLVNMWKKFFRDLCENVKPLTACLAASIGVNVCRCILFYPTHFDLMLQTLFFFVLPRHQPLVLSRIGTWQHWNEVIAIFMGYCEFLRRVWVAEHHT